MLAVSVCIRRSWSLSSGAGGCRGLPVPGMAVAFILVTGKTLNTLTYS